ncbi:MAG: DUF4136 domain-containing protein [Planctomycetota bacterium]
MRRALAALAVVAAASCANPRPTEFVNVAFTISIDASRYRTWAFDFERSEDFDVDFIDHVRLREALVVAISDVLDEKGYPRVEPEEADALIAYEFWIEEGTTAETAVARAQGSLVIRDAKTGEFLWRATRKAPQNLKGGGASYEEGARVFATEMLEYMDKLFVQLQV